VTPTEALAELEQIVLGASGQPSPELLIWAQAAWRHREDKDDLRRVATAAMILALPPDEFNLGTEQSRTVVQFGNSCALFALMLWPGLGEIAGAVDAPGEVTA
jgi:hypothetical protein